MRDPSEPSVERSVQPIAQPSRLTEVGDRARSRLSHERTDERTNEDRPTDDLFSADRSARARAPTATEKLAEARAILASTRASLCPHGVRRRDCRDHQPQEETR